jgi:glycosyltransferase involved in cell wall biosynthesis
MSEINFYAAFKELDIRFIGDKTTGWVVESKIPKNIEYVNLPLKPAWGIDPITTILGPLHAHRSWQYVSSLEQYLQDVDIINISDCFYFYCGQCARLARKLGKKLVTIVWENIPHHPSGYILPYAYQVRSVVSTTDLFIARTEKSAEYIRSFGVPDKKISVVYKGIDTKVFHPGKRKDNKTIRLLYVGQLVATKGINELLQAFIQLSAKYSNIELWICARSNGEPLEKRIQALAQKYPIKLLGSIPYDRLPEIYRQCDIYCHPSQDWRYFGLLAGGNDWFPYAIIEAMASGLPVIGTPVGGIPEQLSDYNIYVEQKNVPSLYNGLQFLITHPLERVAIGTKNASRVKEKFDIIKQAIKTEEVIIKKLA